MTKVLYYLPVDEKYIDQWEYYKVDKEMLNNYYNWLNELMYRLLI